MVRALYLLGETVRRLFADVIVCNTSRVKCKIFIVGLTIAVVFEFRVRRSRERRHLGCSRSGGVAKMRSRMVRWLANITPADILDFLFFLTPLG